MRRKLLIIIFLLLVSYAVFAEANFGFKMQAGSPTYTGSGYSFEGGINLPVMPGGNLLILGLHYNSHFNDPFTTTDLNINDLDFTIGVCVNSEDMAEQMESY